MNWKVANDEYANRVKDSFNKQGIMKTIGAEMKKVVPGEAHIEFPLSDAITQQHGYAHGGIVSAVVDTACGCAAMTLLPADKNVLTVEYKINFLSPASASDFIAIGKVVKPGRTVTVCNGEVKGKTETGYKTIALMQATMIGVSE